MPSSSPRPSTPRLLPAIIKYLAPSIPPGAGPASNPSNRVQAIHPIRWPFARPDYAFLIEIVNWMVPPPISDEDQNENVSEYEACGTGLDRGVLCLRPAAHMGFRR